ncbi:hypothetical protein ACTWPT_56330 [Nonomuraea sp. 3N208]|uniref:hypothetical protein n=1 Tax=Nonomuraea sp. 3N208 TaxID=3457421 RepID=UPI003FD2D784
MWKAAEGQLIAHAGTVQLTPEEDGRTRVQVQLSYNPVVGAAGHAVARLLDADPGDQAQGGPDAAQVVRGARRQPARSG